MFKNINLSIFLYFTLALILAPFHLLDFDTYYYWDWSRHLSLSYYDGSPMIAYLIKLSTMLFGDTLFAFNWLSITVTALTTWLIYKTARLFLTKESSYIAILLWLFSPTVTLVLLNAATYDLPLMLFWTLTIYYTVKYIKFNHWLDFYLIALSCGLMLLSKYSGVVLIFSLIIFLFTTPYRLLFKTYHLYLASLLTMLIFSPVIFWNYQHAWLSFLYQLNSHQLPVQEQGLKGVIAFLFTSKRFLLSLNFLLIPPIICWFKKYYQSSQIIYFNFLTCIVFVGFYLFLSPHTDIRYNWLACYTVSSALLAGFCFQQFHYRHLMKLIICAYAMISVVILLVDSYYPKNPLKKFAYYHLIQQFNTDYPHLSQPILTSGWSSGRLLYFLNNKPSINTLGCGDEENQYSFWSEKIKQRITAKVVLSAIYIDTKEPPSNCLKKYFANCKKLNTRNYADGYAEYKLFAYTCSI